MNTYMFDGHMTYHHSGDAAVYAPNSTGRPWSDDTGPAEDGWEADGELLRSAYSLHSEDDDFGQPGTLVREVWDDAQRGAAVEQIAGTLADGVTGNVLDRALEYWRNIDADLGARIEKAIQEGNASSPAEGMGED
jgi:catalase